VVGCVCDHGCVVVAFCCCYGCYEVAAKGVGSYLCGVVACECCAGGVGCVVYCCE